MLDEFQRVRYTITRAGGKSALKPIAGVFHLKSVASRLSTKPGLLKENGLRVILAEPPSRSQPSFCDLISAIASWMNYADHNLTRRPALKLAEALAERSDCQNRLDDLKKRLIRVARVQEGEKPAEDASELLTEAERLYARLFELVSAINRTNARTPFDKEGTISDAIVRRDVTGKRRDFLTSVSDAASTRQDRYSKSEVKFVATLSVGDLQKEADQLAKEYRVLDTRLQELNWKTELV